MGRLVTCRKLLAAFVSDFQLVLYWYNPELPFLKNNTENILWVHIQLQSGAPALPAEKMTLRSVHLCSVATL